MTSVTFSILRANRLRGAAERARAPAEPDETGSNWNEPEGWSISDCETDTTVLCTGPGGFVY